jgi:hypothetical protein
VAAIASWLAARRVLALDPLRALRESWGMPNSQFPITKLIVLGVGSWELGIGTCSVAS